MGIKHQLDWDCIIFLQWYHHLNMFHPKLIVLKHWDYCLASVTAPGRSYAEK